MEAYIDSRESFKRFKGYSKINRCIQHIDWVKVERETLHMGPDEDENKGRECFEFKYAISNTKASPCVFTAKVWKGQSKKYYKKLYRWIIRKYCQQQNKTNRLVMVSVTVSIMVPSLIFLLTCLLNNLGG